MNEEYLFITCRNLQIRANQTRKSCDIAAWMKKHEEIENKGIMREYEQWYIAQQERKVREWNTEQLLKSVGLLR